LIARGICAKDAVLRGPQSAAVFIGQSFANEQVCQILNLISFY
jgi:hypothetical protein